jgi:gamma-glutamyltranspeptidase / glutathione hydrolase
MAQQREGQAAALPVPGRSVVANRYGVVAASQPLAALAGAQLLQGGGSAVDAAIATNAALAVMEPTGCGLGGDLFALVYEAATGRVHGLNASGWAPAGLTPRVLHAAGLREMPSSGIHSVTVPGAVAGWAALAKRFGRRPFRDTLAAAIHHARDGFPVAQVTASLWQEAWQRLGEDADAAVFLVDGRTPRAGETFRNPDLARTLERIVEHGRAGFYDGETAAAIIAASDARGGALARSDLAELDAEWVEPITTVYRGWTVYETPPPSQGIAALVMLDLMHHFPMGDLGFHSPDALHVMIEAKKLAYADLIARVGDPRFADVPVPAMLDPAAAADRARAIDMERAACRVQPSSLAGVTDREAGETVYLAAADRDGNLVSLIQSNYEGFGSGVVPQRTGFMLQNRGALFTLDPDHPNVLQPRKRPLHTIIPAFMERDGVRIAFGIMGGWNQAQAHAQFVAAIADFGMDIQQALEAGRFTKPTFDGCDVEVEGLVPTAVRDELASRGHRITTHGPRTSTFGYGQAVMSARGTQHGASDPRHDGAAIPEHPVAAGQPLTQ